MALINNPTFTRIYVGADQACRCGCRGSYAEAGTKLFTSRLRTLERLAAQGLKVEDEGDYVNISYGDNRAVTAYRN